MIDRHKNYERPGGNASQRKTHQAQSVYQTQDLVRVWNYLNEEKIRFSKGLLWNQGLEVESRQINLKNTTQIFSSDFHYADYSQEKWIFFPLPRMFIKI